MMKDRFRIIRILSASEVIINGGSDDHINKEDAFKIEDENMEEIRDTDGSVIGEMKLSKGIIYAKEVYKKWTICQTGTKKISSIGPVLGAFASYARPIELNVDPADIDEDLTSDRPVRLGDYVSRITEQKK